MEHLLLRAAAAVKNASTGVRARSAQLYTLSARVFLSFGPASGRKTLASIFFGQTLDAMYLDTHIEQHKPKKSVEFERRSAREVLDVANAVPRVDRVRDLSSGIALVSEAAVQAPVFEQEHVTGL